jgi:preprotein translocase subunit Sec61beta
LGTPDHESLEERERVMKKQSSKEKQARKKIAPIIVASGLISYYAAGATILIKLDFPNIIKIIALIVSIIITVVVIMVLIERIKEINGGEEDDLGKY